MSGIGALKGRSSTEVAGNRSKTSRKRNMHGKKTDISHNAGSILYSICTVDLMEWTEWCMPLY